MKVMVVSRSGLPFPHPSGGAEVVALRQAIALAEGGAEVLLVGQGHLPPGAPARLHMVDAEIGATITSRTRTAYYCKVLAFALVAGLRGAAALRHDPGVRVVHVHHSSTAFVLRFLGGGRRLVYTVHDNPYNQADRGSLFERSIRIMNNLILERAGLWAASHVIAVSPEIVTRLRRWGFPTAKVTELWPVPAPLPEAPEAPQAVDAPLPTGVTSPFILSVGELTGRKRPEILVQALACVPRGIRLVIVGRGPGRPALERLVKDLRLEDRVTLLGWVSSESMAVLQRTARVCVLVSNREGLPTVLLEALREGTPGLYVTTERTTLPNLYPYVHHLVSDSPEAISVAIQAVLGKAMSGVLSRPVVQQWAQSHVPDARQSASILLGIYGRLTAGS